MFDTVTDRGTGRYEARRSLMTGSWEVHDRAVGVTRQGGLDQADAEQLADRLNETHRLYDPPRQYRVRVKGRWGFGDLKIWERRDDAWYGFAKADGVRSWRWYHERDLNEPDPTGVYPLRRRHR